METAQILNKAKNAFNVPVPEQNVGRTERIISSALGVLLGISATRRFLRGGWSLMLPAAYLVYRGASGYCPINAYVGRNTAEGARPFVFKKNITIMRDKSEVYNYWRNLENLPNIMTHIHSVQKINDKQYHWEAMFNDQKFNWNAQITEEIPDQRISWQSLESADIENSGTIEFFDAPDNRGTELKVWINYTPAQTELGKIIAGFLNPVFKRVVKQDLKEFKRKMESGDIPVNKPFVHV
ncbi:MAG TPA: SRPBCC family protein [Bacteroidales bacterium]|nr:SRPBCC family protein [Bacteroidales bacterium]